ncbi:Protein P [Labeo rohita]|uniref:ribonuclease H n=1 Tax=Labeo rohita TaxID=84645 RepID=A0ABQ8L7Z5_LABRO|nr:Protein P [Labeo rohita]
MRLMFKMLTLSQEVPEVCFRGQSIPISGSPILQPRTLTPHFHKVYGCSSGSSGIQGIRILTYIDDWLILAQTEQMAVQHRDVVLAHMKELGLRLNTKKSVLSPLQRTTYLGVVWDSATMQAHLSPARIESILTSVKRVKIGTALF